MSHFRFYKELSQVYFRLFSFSTIIKKGGNSSKVTHRFSFGTTKKEETSQTKPNAQPHGTRLGQKKKICNDDKWSQCIERIGERFWAAGTKGQHRQVS